tara:strand:+ start:2819 stop:3112 length:294 start_codon:yes stop_codon:yes gene_type:complete
MMAAYWVVRVNILDAKKLQAYAPLAAAAVEAHGGCYLARGGAHETTEGSDYGRNVIVSWPDLSTAQTAYYSPEYQKARDVLGDGADRLFVIVDGLPD